MKLRSDHPALAEGRTIFPRRVVPINNGSMLTPASSNRKIGNGKLKIAKGRWKGMPLHCLTLEERKTCPRTCQQWATCYGNNMHMAHRVDHEAPRFYDNLRYSLAVLAVTNPSGFVVRLHVLGDFFSVPYVRWWRDMLGEMPQLHIFGYTHRVPGQGDGIGEEISRMNDPRRCWIRFSDVGGSMSANVGAACRGDEIQCPEQEGKTESCLTCGLCWQTDRAIKFKEH